MTAWARAGRTVANPSRLVRSAPPLRGFGLDRLSSARQRLAKRSRFEMSKTAPFTTDLPGRKRVLRDRDRSFVRVRRDAMLSGCPDHAPAWAFCLTIFTSSRRPGLGSVGRRSTTCRRGPSRTIGPTLCRSPTPSSTCSRHGSAISSMNCSGRTDDLRGQSR
jgi:hypothetical protein